MKFTLFPRNDFNVEVCNHRWGRAMTYCENSDTLQVGTYEPIFYLAFKNNIRLGCFVSTDYTYLQNNKTSALAAKNNIISFDYYSAAVNKTSQDAFNQFIAIRQQWFKNLYGRYASTFSYGGSDMTYSNLGAQKFIAARSNNWNAFGNPYTWFGKSYPTGVYLGEPQIEFDRYKQMLHLMSIRWCDEVASGRYTVSEAMAALQTDILATKNNHGFYNAFAHWHQMINNGYSGVTFSDYENYYSMLNSLNINDDIIFTGFGEAMEYCITRLMIKKISCYTPILSPNKVIIVAEFQNDWNPIINTEVLNTPLSIKVNLSNTPLAGKNIKLSYGNCIKLSSNQYIVDLTPPKHGNVSFVELTESSIPTELNVNRPNGNYTINNNNINVVLSQKCNVMVFRKGSNQTTRNSTIIDYLYNVTSFSIIQESGFNYAFGFINDFGKSNLIDWI